MFACEYTDPDAAISMTLADLGFGALDLVALSDTADASLGATFTAYILYTALSKGAPGPPRRGLNQHCSDGHVSTGGPAVIGAARPAGGARPFEPGTRADARRPQPTDGRTGLGDVLRGRSGQPR